MNTKVYYINHNVYQKGDVKKAWNYAVKLIERYEYIDTITILVNQSRQYEPFIKEELGIGIKYCKEHICPNNLGRKIQIHTVRTYSPDFISSGERGRELLVAVGVPIKELVPLLDKNRVEFWIIVPRLLSENAQLLRIYNAIDIETGESYKSSFELDGRVKHAIEWINDKSNPNELFIHPYDEDRLRQMANTLSHYKISFDYEAVVRYCIMRGIFPTSAFQIADYFTKAQRRKFSTMFKVDYKFMRTQLERTDWI